MHISSDELSLTVKHITTKSKMVVDESDRLKLFVGSLNFASSETGLRTCFSRFGRLGRVQIVQGREPGRSKGFGFVTFEDERDMRAALATKDPILLDGRTLTISKATSSKAFTERQEAAVVPVQAPRFDGGARDLQAARAPAIPADNSFGIHFTNLPPPFTWRELKDLLNRGGADDVIYTTVTQPGIGLGEVGSDAERRRVIKTLDGTMVDRFKIAVYVAESSQQAAQGSRQPEIRHSGAVREVISPRGTAGYHQNSGRDAAATQAPPPRNTFYDTPASRVSHHSIAGNSGPVMRPQEVGRKRELDAGPSSLPGQLVSRVAHNAPSHLVANYAAREQARSHASARVVGPDSIRSSAGPDSYRDAPQPRREEAVYGDNGGYAQQQPAARDSGGGYVASSAHVAEQGRSSYAPSAQSGRAATGGPMQRPGLAQGFNAGSANDGYTQSAVYLDPPPRDSQQQQQQQQYQQSYNGGGQEAPRGQQHGLRYDDATPSSRNGGGGDMYAPARGQQQPASQGGMRYEADGYAAPERPSAPLHYVNEGGSSIYPPAREILSPPVLQQAPPPLLYDSRSSERAYQPVTAPPPMSGYHMSSIDSAPSSQYSSRGYDNAGSRGAPAVAAAPEYQPAQRSNSGPQYSDDGYNPPAGNANRQMTYEPVMIPRPLDGGGMRREESIRPGGALVVSGYASEGYAPPREQVRQSGYAEEYQHGARVQPLQPTYEPVAAAVSYDRQQQPTYASRLPALDRGMDESRGAGMDGRGTIGQRDYPAREPVVQMQESERQYGVREPVREYAQHPVRQVDRYEAPIQQQQLQQQQGREPERRSERELMQMSARQPMQQQQQQFMQQPARGSFQQNGNQDGPPRQPGGGDSRGGRGGGLQGAGGPQRGGPNTFRTVRDGRPY